MDNSKQVRKIKRSRRSRSRRSRRSITARETRGNNRAKQQEEEEIVKWIQCDSCKKWRVVPIGNDIDMLLIRY